MTITQADLPIGWREPALLHFNTNSGGGCVKRSKRFDNTFNILRADAPSRNEAQSGATELGLAWYRRDHWACPSGAITEELPNAKRNPLFDFRAGHARPENQTVEGCKLGWRVACQ